MVQGGNWQKKTEQEYHYVYSLLAKILGDIPIAVVTHEEARLFKDTMRKLPSNMTKKKKYRNRTIPELVAMKVPTNERLSITKINTYLSRVSTLFNWSVTHGYTAQNPFKGLGLKQKVLPHEKRMVFDKTDLQKLFTTPVYNDLLFKHSYYYWLPLIGLYSGARIEEICQLHLEDIHIEDGIWVFDINGKDKKKLKTQSSQRLIPIHQKLIGSGLLEHVKQLSDQGKIRLFPELKKQRDGFSQAASKWFGRYRRKYGVPHKRKTFHSFRHTVADQLKQKSIPKEKIAAIMGHKEESITTGLYGKKYTPGTLKPVIDILGFNLEIRPFEE